MGVLVVNKSRVHGGRKHFMSHVNYALSFLPVCYEILFTKYKLSHER